MGRTLIQALGACTIVGFFLTAFTPAVDLLERLTAPEEPAQRAEAIVVLGVGGVAPGGGLTDRSLRATLEGIRLYREGWAPLLVLSGAASGSRRAEAEVRAELARQLGVPASSILTLSTANTTRDEALGIRALLEPRAVRRILLVVEAPARMRASEAFSRVGFQVATASSNPGAAVLRNPEDRLHELKQLGLELAARAYYRVMGYL
ncbi:MAG TPA: YdcF family protein [Methylomirabilota bacterium]|nr:YdcF family protein [Methylomirabilota bacterium]